MFITLHSLVRINRFRVERLPLTYATYLYRWILYRVMEIYLTEIAMTHLAGSNDEGRILCDKNSFLCKKFKLSKQQKTE